MVIRILFFGLLASVWAGCGESAVDDTDTGECFDFFECEEDEACLRFFADSELGQCVPLSSCQDAPGLVESIEEAFLEDSFSEPLDVEFSLCEKDAPVSCVRGSDTLIETCTLRDSSFGSGCFFDISIQDATPGGVDFPGETRECENSACFEIAGEATCIPTCAQDSECPSGESCQLRSGNGLLVCTPEGSGPSASSTCSVTILDAVSNNKQELEGTNFNNPDFFVIVTSGGRTETTFVVEGDEEPVWNTTFEGFSFGEVAAMEVKLMEDDEDFDVFSNDDDEVGVFNGVNGTWFMSSMSQQFDFVIPDVVPRFSLRVDCE